MKIPANLEKSEAFSRMSEANSSAYKDASYLGKT